MSIDPEALLRRDATAQALTRAGFPTSSATLATKAVRGGGPPYQLYGRVPLYRWGAALAWAESRMSAPRRTTSEGACANNSPPQAVPQVPVKAEPPSANAMSMQPTGHYPPAS
jgi:hypothetical protein